MVRSLPIISKQNTASSFVSGSAKGFFAGLASHYSVHARDRKVQRLTPGRPLKKLFEAAADPEAEIWFGDEVHFQLHTTTTRMWALKGHQPEIASKPGREKVGFIGVVCPATGELFAKIAFKFNTTTFIGFLKCFLAARKGSGKKIWLVLDNASWHKKALWQLALENPDDLGVIFLPPYSPDLNPIERLWRLTRRFCTHNKYFDSLDELAATVFGFFSIHADPNDTLRQLCAIT